ncbi:MAG: hypothetical protein RKP20_15720 [Candidatus Competibacter sp.]|nr:hypothetical protein [Candidatus Competibacter sp.]MDS4042609.1 hypothetical protein [Candidatus Competibacter sp.]
MSETKVGGECGVALTLWLALIYRLDRQPWRVMLALRHVAPPALRMHHCRCDWNPILKYSPPWCGRHHPDHFPDLSKMVLFSTAGSKDQEMPWSPGESGNPAGRRSNPIRERFMELAEPHIPEIVAMLVGAAKGGDVQAAAALLDRV